MQKMLSEICFVSLLPSLFDATMNQSFPPSESAPSSTKLNAPSEQVSNAASVAKRFVSSLLSLSLSGMNADEVENGAGCKRS